MDDSAPLTMDCMGIALTVGVRRAVPEDAWAVALVLKHAFCEYEPLYTRKGYEATTPKQLRSSRVCKRDLCGWPPVDNR